jgi:hypothetical protein
MSSRRHFGAMAKVHSEERRSHSKLKKVLNHMAGGYIIKATLRAGIAKGLPP